jgi:hypothetical protein
MVERRARKGDVDLDEKSDLWRESVERYNDKRRQVARLEWHAFHCGQAARHRATLQALVEHHEEQAQRLMDVRQEEPA